MSITVGTQVGQEADHGAGRAAGQARLRPPVARLALLGAVAGAGALGVLAGGDAAGSDLLVLMRFMAGVKAAMALGAVALVWWRMGAPMGRGMAAAYVVSAAVMAAGPGLIWDMQHVVLGAVAVHGGLSALMVAGWLDRAAWNGALGAAVARRRLAR